MTMRRPDFKAIAKILRERHLKQLNQDGLDLYLLCEELAVYFKRSNPTFDREQFMRDAGWYNG
jgi:hypothetical protein